MIIVLIYRRAAVVSLTAIALAACSSSGRSGDGSTAPNTSATSPAAPTTPTTSAAPAGGPLTAAQARAIARAGHLVGADLPGYAQKTGSNDQSDAHDAELAKCIGVALPSYVFHDPGVEFHQGDAVEVDSSVDSVARASDVKASVHAFLGAKAPGCFERQFRALVRQQGATESDLHVTRFPVHVRGADVTFGLRLSGTFVVQGTRAQISSYQLGAGVGQAEIAVSMVDAGVTLTAGAPDEAQLSALLQKSVARVVAAYPH